MASATVSTAFAMIPYCFGAAARLALRFTTFRPLSFTVLRLAFFAERFAAGLRTFLRTFCHIHPPR